MHLFATPGSATALNNMKRWTLMLLQGQVESLLVWLEHLTDQPQLSPAQNQRLVTIYGYFEANRRRMRYDE